MKSLFLTFLMTIMLFPFTVSAQDKLFTRNGGQMEVKITEVGVKMITYKKWSNQNGPDFVIAKSNVDRIKYQNGEVEYFGKTEPSVAGSSNKIAGKNILSILPIAMNNTSATGLGLSFERTLDRKYFLSFYLPVVYSFNDNYSTYNSSTGLYDKDHNRMIWFYPSLKIYPTGSDGIVRYAVGPTIAVGSGFKEYTTQTWYPGQNVYLRETKKQNVFLLGFLVNNSLNVQPSPHFHLGLDLGVGIPYYSSESSITDPNYSTTYENVPIVQFNFNLGYRF